MDKCQCDKRMGEGCPLCNQDPWVHRSKNMLCPTCMYYMPKASEVEKKLGRCRRHAPTMNGYPVVFETDWCGDHKIDEAKI